MTAEPAMDSPEWWAECERLARRAELQELAKLTAEEAEIARSLLPEPDGEARA